MSAKRAILLSLASWGLLALCFPPYLLGPVALAVLAPWFYVLRMASKKVALISSYLGSFFFHAISMYWLYHVGDVAPQALIYSGLLLGIAYLSLYALLCAWVFVKIRDRFGEVLLIVIFPLFWAGIETLRAKGDMSFPWLSFGLVFGGSIELMQTFALFGVFGCSAIIIASNMCLVTAFLKKKKKLAFVPLILAVCFYIGGYAVMSFEDNVKDEVETLTVAVMQPSIPQTRKWNQEYYDSVMKQTWDLFETLDPLDVALILFPETAIPDYINYRRREYSYLKKYAAENDVAIVIGALNRDRHKREEKKKPNIYNSAFLFGPDEPKEYRKTRLVPFSEKLPFDNVVPAINYVDLGGGDFTPGDSLTVWQPGSFSPFICYEAIYGSILRDAKRKGAKFIANLTNDGWFKRSIAPYQHFNLVRSHAVENGIGVVRSANTGISAFIKPNGRVIERTELFEQRIIVQDMPLKTRFTPYSVIGDYVEWVLFAFSLFMIVFARLNNKSPQPKQLGAHEHHVISS
ncbi:MAG: apolipoprotein N-acyltransferase [Fibromonadaceae bacterium]|jgi:apolipoprotein N-acyltransferase|nr:apolipoprotein N-acyltransferase [Fibromonadaceae bacterium]